MNHPIEIDINDPHAEVIEDILTEVEWCIQAIRDRWKKTDDRIVHTADLDDLLARQHAIAVVWTADDIRKIVPHLNDAQALTVIADCFRIFNPDETANREMIFQAAERLYPTLSQEQRCRRAGCGKSARPVR
jgi:hypothetical protein